MQVIRTRPPGAGTVRAHLAPWRGRRLRTAARRILVNDLGMTMAPTAPFVDGPRRMVVAVEDASGRQLVAKAAFGRHLAREHALHSWAAASGVAVPAIVHFRTGALQLMVTERIAGPSLEDLDDPAAWRAAGALLRRLHELRPPPIVLPVGPAHWLADIRSEAVRACRAGALTPADAARVVNAAAAAAPLLSAPAPTRLAHGDCMPKHVLFDDRRGPHVIDLEWLRLDDPAWDLGVLTTFHADRLPDVLDGYGADPVERQRLEDVIPVRQLERLIRGVSWNAVNGHDVGPCRWALERLLRHH